MVQANPFKAPETQDSPMKPGAGENKYAPCPTCGKKESTKVGFTWWGGAVGSSVLTHVQCPACRTRYNGKSGKSNNTAIAIYTVVVTTIVVALMIAIRM